MTTLPFDNADNQATVDEFLVDGVPVPDDPTDNAEPLPVDEFLVDDVPDDIDARMSAAGIDRSTTDPVDLLPDGIDQETGCSLSVMEFIQQTPLHPLPEPIARDADVADAIASLLGGRVRYYKTDTKGGTFEVWSGDGFKAVSDEWMERLISRLIHPTLGYQVIRPVLAKKLTVEDKRKLEAAGLVELNIETQTMTDPRNPEREIHTRYISADDWTGKSTTNVSILRQLRGTLATKESLDRGEKLHVPNGLIDVSREGLVSDDGEFTVTIEPTLYTDPVRRTTACAPNLAYGLDFSKVCPVWIKMIRDAMSYLDRENNRWIARPEHERVLQKFAGLTLTPRRHEEMFAILYGEQGNNGKSIVADTLKDVLADYGYLLGAEAISKTVGTSHPTDLMGLDGARLAVIHEMQANAWDIDKTKRLTSDRELKARRMGQDMQSLIATHKLIVTANEIPATESPNFWRRGLLIPFDARWMSPNDSPALKSVSIAPANRNLPDLLKSEWDGILLWMLHGLYLYHTEGLEVPASLIEIVDEAKSASGFATFVKDCIEYTGDPKDHLDARDIKGVWGHYVKHILEGRGEYPFKMKDIIPALRGAVPNIIKRGGTNGDRSADSREKVGAGGVRWSELGISLGQAANIIPRDPMKPAVGFKGGFTELSPNLVLGGVVR